MPELPEVETVVRGISPFIVDKKVLEVKINDLKLKRLPIIKITGCIIKKVERIGKNIAIELLDGKNQSGYLIVHLRMTGNLIWNEENLTKYYSQKHNLQTPRIKFIFKNGELNFFDTRRFGTVQYYSTLPEKLLTLVDPLSPSFTFKYLKEILLNKRNIKVLLLDQAQIAGIGNIYASEILFRSKILPTCAAESLSLNQQKSLFENIKRVLNLAIKYNGTTFSDFKDGEGQEGKYQKLLKVYNRENKECFVCKTKINRIVIAQRSTFYCKSCQK